MPRQTNSQVNTQESASATPDPTLEQTFVDPGTSADAQQPFTNMPQESSSAQVAEDTTTFSSDTSTTMDQSQTVMEGNSAQTMNIPASRTGLIRPTASSTWERPPDPTAPIQPGLITASIFFLFGLLALGLCLTRRWRRNRTRARARSVINLLNRARNDSDHGSTRSSHEKFGQRHGVMYDAETTLEKNSFDGSDDLKPPVKAKTRFTSTTGFKDAPVLPGLNLPHVPAKPSPLRSGWAEKFVGLGEQM